MNFICDRQKYADRLPLPIALPGFRIDKASLRGICASRQKHCMHPLLNRIHE